MIHPDKLRWKLLTDFPPLPDWEFGLDRAATHIFAVKYEVSRVRVWVCDLRTFQEKTLDFESRQIASHRCGWLGHQTTQSMFGTVVMVHWESSKIFWSNWKSEHVQNVSFERTSCGVQFQADTRLLSRGYAPALIRQLGGLWAVHLESQTPRLLHPLHPPTRANMLTHDRRPGIHTVFIAQPYPSSGLVPSGGIPRCRFLYGKPDSQDLGHCLGLTRFGGMVLRGSGSGVLKVAEHGPESTLELEEYVLGEFSNTELLFAATGARGTLVTLSRAASGSCVITEWG